MTNGLRPLGPDDASAAAALIRRAFGAIVEPLHPPPSGTRITAEEVAAGLAAGGGAGWRAGSALLGCVLWRPEEGGLYLGRLAVDPAARNRGIARALVAAVEEEARRLRLPFVFLKVRLPLAGNRRLFAACGFVENGYEAHPGCTVPTTVRAEKRLTRGAVPDGT